MYFIALLLSRARPELRLVESQLDRPRPGIDRRSLHLGHLQRSVGKTVTMTRRHFDAGRTDHAARKPRRLVRASLPWPLERDARSGSLDARRRSDSRHEMVDLHRNLRQL